MMVYFVQLFFLAFLVFFSFGSQITELDERDLEKKALNRFDSNALFKEQFQNTIFSELTKNIGIKAKYLRNLRQNLIENSHLEKINNRNKQKFFLNNSPKRMRNSQRKRGRRHLGKRRRFSRKKSRSFQRRSNRSKKRSKEVTRSQFPSSKNSFYTMSIGSGQRIIIAPLFNNRRKNESFSLESNIRKLSQPSERLLQAVLEIFVSVKRTKTRARSRSRQPNLNVILHMIKKQDGGKERIIARGKLRDQHQIKSRRSGSNRSGRMRFSTKVLKYQFTVTNLSPNNREENNNFTERSKYLKLSKWRLPSFDLALICVNPDLLRPVMCPHNVVKITESRLVLRTIREGS